MNTYRVGIIGTGRPWKSEGATGFGMAHSHVRGYQKTGRCQLIAVCDIVRQNAESFAAQYGGAAVYDDYGEMLRAERPDIVSICTWPHLHAPMTLAAIESGARGIYCEKPIAPTWSEARQMHQAAQDAGVTLAFNHQRRFLAPFQKARQLLDDGAIGPLLRIEGQCDNLFDWGTHWLDMFFFYNHETPAQWVIGQIHCSSEKSVFGVRVEDQGICHFKFQNEVRGLLVTGFEAALGCANRLIGESGVIEIAWSAPWLRVWIPGRDREDISTEEGIHDSVGIDRAIADFVHSLDQSGDPLLSSKNAIRATEVIFATYESSRRRGRVDLPLEEPDSALLTMIEQGEIGA